MMALHGKHYYPANVYPYLMAAGGVAIEAWTSRRKALQPVVITAAMALGLVFVPFAMPILPEELAASYTNWLFRTMHLSRQAVATEHNELPALPSDWADMHGWPDSPPPSRKFISPCRRATAPRPSSPQVITVKPAAIDFFGRTGWITPGAERPQPVFPLGDAWLQR